MVKIECYCFPGFPPVNIENCFPEVFGFVFGDELPHRFRHTPAAFHVNVASAGVYYHPAAHTVFYAFLVGVILVEMAYAEMLIHSLLDCLLFRNKHFNVTLLNRCIIKSFNH